MTDPSLLEVTARRFESATAAVYTDRLNLTMARARYEGQLRLATFGGIIIDSVADNHQLQYYNAPLTDDATHKKDLALDLFTDNVERTETKIWSNLPAEIATRLVGAEANVLGVYVPGEHRRHAPFNDTRQAPKAAIGFVTQHEGSDISLYRGLIKDLVWRPREAA